MFAFKLKPIIVGFFIKITSYFAFVSRSAPVDKIFQFDFTNNVKNRIKELLWIEINSGEELNLGKYCGTGSK